MLFASDFNMDDLIRDATLLKESADRGECVLPNLSNLENLIAATKQAIQTEMRDGKESEYCRRMREGQVWTVDDAVIVAFMQRVITGWNDHPSCAFEVDITSFDSHACAVPMFRAMICGDQNSVTIGFCPMERADAIAHLTVKTVRAFSQLELLCSQFEYPTFTTYKAQVEYENGIHNRPFVHFF